MARQFTMSIQVELEKKHVGIIGRGGKSGDTNFGLSPEMQ